MGLFKKRKSTAPPTSSKDSISSIRHSFLLTSKHSKEIGRNMTSTTPHNVSIPIGSEKPPPPPDPSTDPVGYLKTLAAVRERSNIIKNKALKDELNHFDVDMSKFSQTVKWVVSIIKRDYAPDYSKIPPHGRWQHFDVGGRPRVDQLLTSWPTSTVDSQERARRLIDLFVVSVLLDAGAGTQWRYKSKLNGKSYSRSEGLAVASIEMFQAGLFSENASEPHQVNAAGLKALTATIIGKGLQVTSENPIDGLEGRTGLLVRLGGALLANRSIFGDTARPGNMLDHLLSHPDTQASGKPIIKVTTLWDTLMVGLGPIWPASRTQLNGVSLGDAWPCTTMPQSSSQPWESIVPFHKLTQWLCYSLMVPIERMIGANFIHGELLTGLPEYRNGGLLIDTGLLTLKEADKVRGEAAFQDYQSQKGTPCVEVVPAFAPHDDVIVEWRAVTVGYLDEIHKKVCEELGVTLNLAQVLEAGTWKGGREIAAVSRPNTKEPPIVIISDGTVF